MSASYYNPSTYSSSYYDYDLHDDDYHSTDRPLVFKIVGGIILGLVGLLLLYFIAFFLFFVGKSIVKRVKGTNGRQNDVENGTEMQPPAYGEKTPATTSVEVRGLPEQPAPAYTV